MEKRQIKIKVIAGSSIDKITENDGIIKVKIREIAKKGKANKAVIDLISKIYKIHKKNIKIIKGQHSPNKVIEIIN
jgi:uncharacterized protein (TIGR00251 family)